MDSDTDSESEIPPCWEIKHDGFRKYYYNYILNEKSDTHPLKIMRRFYKETSNFKTIENLTKPSRTCISSLRRMKRSSNQFIQKYDAFTTAEQVLGNKDLTEKCGVVIGGCSGIGLETIFYLISANCHVILGCPDLERCSRDVETKVGTKNFQEFVTIIHLDLRILSSVKQFVETVTQKIDLINFVILNAAIMNPPYNITGDGYEESFQVNLLSQVYLVQLLLNKCHEQLNVEMRFVFTVCECHRAINSLKWSDFNPIQSDYDGLYAYSLHHLCRLIIMKHFQQKYCHLLTQDNKQARIFLAVHPGNIVSRTSICRYSSYIVKFLYQLSRPFTKSLSQASGVLLYGILTSSLCNFSGQYFNNYCICEPSNAINDINNQNILLEYLKGALESVL